MDFNIQDGDFFVFGKETKGLPAEILEADKKRHADADEDEVRSLNLSNSAAIMVYEALRQLDFPKLV